MKRVFITGIEGFVGRYLAEELLREGYEVGGFYYKHASSEHLEEYPVRLFAGDVSDRRENFWLALDEFSPDAVVHLAAITFVPQSHQDPLNTWRTNLFGTLNLLEWARQKKPDTKVLVVSSGEVYGAPQDESELPFEEHSRLNPQNVYAATKVAADLAAQQYPRVWGMKVIVARPFNHTGPGQSPNFVASAFARQIAEIALGLQEPVVKVGNLSAHRDFSDVRDIVRGYRLLLEKVEDGVFNLCSGKPTPIRWILDKLVEIAGVDVRVETDPARLRPVDVPLIYGSHKKITEAAGWEPQIPLERTLADLLEWWKQKLRNN